jgi:fructuronate reductase
VRIAHIGLGNFFRAHQAWYTNNASDAERWGIAAFTGRSTELATALGAQDCLYTLITRATEGDTFEVMSSLSAVHPGSDHEAWLRYAASPDLALVTLTVTETGYARGADGGVDPTDPRVAADVEALRGDLAAPVGSAPGRLLAGLLARHRAGGSPIAVVSCDNVAGNGAVTSRVVHDLAVRVDPGLAAVVDEMASFPSTMVDRITPRTTEDDRVTVTDRTGREDAAPVATEPFSEWVLSGAFPAGRPAWEDAGARLVDDVAPYEERKLWLLNGGHSLLAYAGSIRGNDTVDQAVADPACRSWLLEFWDEASPLLPFSPDVVTSYTDALLDRFSNQRIGYRLAQIATDGSQKIPVRVLPTLRAQREAGKPATGAARVVAAWTCHLRGHGAPIQDSGAEAAVAAAQGSPRDAARRVLARLDPGLAEDSGLVDVVTDLMAEVTGEQSRA